MLLTFPMKKRQKNQEYFLKVLVYESVESDLFLNLPQARISDR